jgi:hypothetical protein
MRVSEGIGLTMSFNENWFRDSIEESHVSNNG